MELSRFKAVEMIKSTGGRIFSATFIKRDGSERTINARLGVQADLKGGKNGASEKNAYLTVYDMVNKGYRMINLETLQQLTINRTAYRVV
jgi:hypothetical protein